MLALDHRQSIKKLINPQNPNITSDGQVINFKREVINALKDQFSGLLIDEVWGLEACKEICQDKPFLLPLEKSGYINKDGERITELEYTVSQIKNLGASGAKLLIYFNPNTDSAKSQLETARKAVKECRSSDFPLFLEIVTYGNTGNRVYESVRAFKTVDVIPSVWKLEYPGSRQVCQEITTLVGSTPWILLTGGDEFGVFKSHLQEAVNAGASGFLAGRALWQELPKLAGQEKEEFLKNTLPQRFRTIASIAKESS